MLIAQRLSDYFQGHRDHLSEDSLARLERNPLRIVDSKDERDKRIVADAPTIAAYLTPEAARFYDDLKRHLHAFGVPFTENPRIVRGLDYYGHTAFEFVTTRLGAQGTVMGGGRYEGLVQEMGGPPTPAVGWAAGIERLSMLLNTAPLIPLPSPSYRSATPQRPKRSASSSSFTKRASAPRWRIAAISAAVWNGPIASARAPPSFSATRTCARGVAQVKDLASGAQTAVPLAELADHLR